MFWLLFLFGFTFFVFAPFEFYMTNNGDLWFSIYDFGGYLLIAFVVYVLFIYIISKLFVKSIAIQLLSFILFLLTIDLYIQGNFLRTDYGQLDGQPIVWSEYAKSGIISIVVLVVILLSGFVAYIKCNRSRLFQIAKIVSICIVLVQVVTLSTLLFSKGALDNGDRYVVTDRNEWTYSPTDNFVIMILDSYDSRVFDELYKDGFKEEFEDTFKDFTYYRNTVDSFSLTDFSVPQIVTGTKYLNQSTYGEYLEDGYTTSPILNELEKKNYELNVYVKTNIPQGEVTARISNWSKQTVGVSSHKRLLIHLYKLVGFRYLPQQLKQLSWTYTEAIDDVQTIDMDDNLIEWANWYFRDNIANINVNAERPTLHLFHLKGIHVPRNYDSAFNPVSKEVDLWESAKGVNLMLAEYLDKLKELGIYDNANIVILADHAANEYENSEFKQCPILLVKGMNESHDFIIDEQPVSYDDLQTGFVNLSNGHTDNIFNISTDDVNRPRYHYETTWLTRTISNDEKNNDFVEYVINAHAFETDKFKATGKVY